MSKGVLRHLVFFRIATHRGLEIFQLMIRSEDMSLDGVLRQKLVSLTELGIVDATQSNVSAGNRIVIYDCRRGFPDIDNPFTSRNSIGHANLALIGPEYSNRQSVFTHGFADFLSWPVLMPELYIRLLAHCQSLSLSNPQYRYSRVELVERCCSYLIENMAGTVQVIALARMFNTNHNTLNTSFKREMGLPPLAWQRKMRLEAAAHQLRMTDSSVSIIAERFGYELPSNFATAFRRHFGVSPQHYRKTEWRRT